MAYLVHFLRKDLSLLVSLIICFLAMLGGCMAAGLMVEAVVPTWTGDALYLADTNGSLGIWVSVLDLDGKPVEGLDASSFMISTLMVPKEFYRNNVSVVGVDKAYTRRMDLTTYKINVAPEGSETWAKGGYVLLIEVVRGDDRGQAMLPLSMAKLRPSDVEGNVGSAPAKPN